jgi:hypothetical protein
MEYKLGEVWFSDEINCYVKTVRDEHGSCEHCVFSEDKASGASCPAKSYDWHPCYHSERKDGNDVHFELATDEDIQTAHPLNVGDRVLWADKHTPIDKERVYEVFEVREDMVKIADDYSEAEVPWCEVIKLED